MILSELILPAPAHFRCDLHEAKHLAEALDRLAPWQRIRWLRLCCLRLSQGSATRIDVVRSSGETRDVLVDFWSICSQGGLSLEWATGLAEHLNRGKDVRELLLGG